MIDYNKILSEKAMGLKPSGIRKFFDMLNEIKGVIALTVGQPDFVTPWHVRAAAIESLERGETYYTSNAGMPELRSELSKYLKRRFDLEYPSDELLITVGGSEAIDVAIRAVVNPGDEVIVPIPSFVCYEPIARMAGAEVVTINTRPEDGFKLTPEALKAAITEKTKLLVLPYPNNPTGAILERRELEKIADVLRGTDILVLSDEIYESLTYDRKPCRSIRSYPGMAERTIIINGMSKRFAMTGWRLGWAIAPAELISQMTKMQENIVACAPLPAQYAALEALSDRTDAAFIREEFQHRRDVLYNGINAIPGLICKPVPATFYAMVDISGSGLEAEDFVYRMLREVKVATVFGPAYGGETYKDFIRIAFTMKEERLKIALERIAAFMEKIKK